MLGHTLCVVVLSACGDDAPPTPDGGALVDLGDVPDAGASACATLCGHTAFDCTQLGSPIATANISAPEADGCSGIIAVTGSTEAPMFWVHCDRAEVCVENVGECFPATLTVDSFAYTIPARAPITCVAR